MYMGTEAGPRYWPVAHIIGYEHTFINTVADLVGCVATGKPAWPDFLDGCKTQAALEACGSAHESKKWERVPRVS